MQFEMKARIKKSISDLLNRYGYHLVLDSTYKKLLRAEKLFEAPPSLLFQVDPVFQSSYAEGRKVSGTPEAEQFVSIKRQHRHYNLLSLHRWVSDVPGWQVECGCWKGLSSYLINQQSKRLNPAHDGSNYMIVDSFEGLSEPTAEDNPVNALDPDLFSQGFIPKAGMYDSPEESVKGTLSEFPAIEFHKGWIPGVLSSLPERTYSFVHIDLDLHDPVRGAIDYFYPRLAKGGVVLLDDYGSLYWPGAMKAGNEGAAAFGQTLIPLSSGQALLIRR